MALHLLEQSELYGNTFIGDEGIQVGRGLFDDEIVLQLVEKFPAFYGI